MRNLRTSYRQFLRHLIIFCVASFGIQAVAADRFIIVSQRDHSAQVAPDDIVDNAIFVHDLKTVFDEALGSIKLNHVQVDKLSDLSPVLHRNLPIGDVVRGIVLLGHGAPGYYTLNAREIYSGSETARSVSEALRGYSDHRPLIVYFSACECGLSEGPKVGIQESFIDEFQRIDENNGVWENVFVIAHQDVTVSSRDMPIRKNSLLRSIFFRSGFADSLRKFDAKIEKIVGSAVFNRHGPTIKSVIPAALAAKTVLTFGEHTAPAILSGLTSSFLVSLVIFPRALERFDRQRNSWVRVRDQNGESDSTTFSALLASLDSSNKFCSPIFN